jgi:hypothetical protein
MKTIAWGAFALNVTLITAGILLLGLALWVLVPAALPVHFTYLQGVALGCLLFLARGIFSK